MKRIKNNLHTPAHLFIDNTLYFITSSVYGKRNLLADSELKTQLLETVKENFLFFNWKLDHWVILDNHYHSAKLIRSKTNCETPIWWNYWDYCPRNEREYFIRLNYLLMNPIKHGYVQNLNDYKFSSFHTLIGKIGRAS